MAESILVTGKKISSMELVTNMTGNEKIPTGQPDDLALTPNQIADHTIIRGDLASQEDLSQVEVSLGTQITDLTNDVTSSNNSIRGLIAAEEAARIAADNLKVDKEGSVSSVAGRVGDVLLAPSDVLVEGFGSQEDVNKYVAKPFLSGYTYGLGERVVLGSGEVVKSLADGNVGNPNEDMTGWVSAVSDSLSDTVQTFNTPEAGVDPVTGVADGAYFNVRSSSDETYVDEYQNVGGVPTPTGKSCPSSEVVSELSTEVDELDTELKRRAPTVSPEMFGAVGDGITDDLSAWQAMLDSKPARVECKPGARYFVSAKVYSKDEVVINGNGATYFGPKPITSVAMAFSNVVGAHAKGVADVNVVDGSLFKVGDRVMIYYGQDNSDAWFIANQRNPDQLGITSQITNILAVNGNVLTLTNGLDSEVVTTYNSRVQKIYDYRTVINNLKIGLSGTYYDNLNVCNVHHHYCHFYQVGAAPAETTYRDQTSFNTIFNKCSFDERLKIMYGYGSHSGLTVDCVFKDGVAHDAVWITYAGPVNCLSIRNKFFRNNSGIYSDTVAGVYIGAKSRYCHSIDDYVDGLAIGFRVMFGALDCQVVRFVARHTKSTYSAILTNSQRIKILDGYFESGQVRTLDVDDFEFTGNTMLSSYRGVGVPPLKLDLNRIDSEVKAKGYIIKDNYVEGEMRTWVAIDGFKIINNKAAIFNSVTSVASTDVEIRNNKFGWMRLYNFIASVTGNKIDYSTLDATAFPKDQAVELYGNTWVKEFHGNQVIHNNIGVQKTGLGFDVLALGENIIKAPNQYSIAPTETVKPIAGQYILDNVPVGFKARLTGYGITTKAYWVWDGATWYLDSDYGRKYLYPLNFTPVASGVFTADPRTIVGLRVSDNVIIDSPTVNPANGQFLAKVVADDTLQIYYRNYTADVTPVNHTVYVTVLK